MNIDILIDSYTITFIGIFIAIFIFSVIVITHELGHFLAARFFRVKVDEFGLGIPPRATSLFTDKKGTLFSLNWLPLGGFVRLKGETPEVFSLYNSKQQRVAEDKILEHITNNTPLFDKNNEKISLEEQYQIRKIITKNNDSDNFGKAPLHGQIIIILGGIIMNFLLAFIIFFGLFLYGVKPIGINSQLPTDLEIQLLPTVEQALENGLLEKKQGVAIAPISESIAEKSGLVKDMIITEINEKKLESVEEFIAVIGENKTEHITLSGYKIGKNGEKSSFTKHITVPETGQIGVYIKENININPNYTLKYDPIQAGKYAFLETKNQVLLTFSGLKMLGQKVLFPKTQIERTEAVKSVSGPIGIVDFISNSFSAGIIFLLVISALISINLGVFNLLPIPALDGGKFIFILVNGVIEKVFGKKIVGVLVENFVHIIFFVFLIALSIIIGYNDVVKILEK